MPLLFLHAFVLKYLLFFELGGSSPNFAKMCQNAALKYKNIFRPTICLKTTIYSKNPQDTYNILWVFRFAVFSSYKDGGGEGIRTPVGLHPNGFQDRLVMTASIRLHIFNCCFFAVSSFYNTDC